jgi:hypothetical protein
MQLTPLSAKSRAKPVPVAPPPMINTWVCIGHLLSSRHGKMRQPRALHQQTAGSSFFIIRFRGYRCFHLRKIGCNDR